MSNFNYKATVPLNQIIYNTPYHHKKFSSVGVPVLDTPLETIIPIVANNEEFKAPSSKAVYDAIQNLRDTTIQVDYLNNNIDYNNPNNNLTVPSTAAVINAINDIIVNSDVVKNIIIQDIRDNIVDKVVSSEGLYEALNNITLNQIPLHTYQFPEPSLEWVVNHNKNTFNFQENVFNNLKNKIYASVSIIDENNFKISFTEATSGFVTVKF